MKKYQVLNKVLIPKEEYFAIIDKLKKLSDKSESKSNHEYYTMSQFEILQCVDKLIKNRKCKEDQPIYYVYIEETYDAT